jgi:Mechanosensitive ion channel, conserved TM helix
MNNTARDLFYSLGEKMFGYLPNLFAGILLIGLGWLFGWFVKRLTVRICILFRVDRWLGRFRWGSGLSKADIRYAFYNAIGNVAFFAVFLVFLNAALDSLQLPILSNLLQKSVLFFPKAVIALLIVGLGWLIANKVAVSIQKALLKEEIPRATLSARFVKFVLMLFFSAIALTELDIAREIVVIGFTVTFVTLGILMTILTSNSGRGFIGNLLEIFSRKDSRGL